MNYSTLFLHHQYHSATASIERRTPVRVEADPLIERALERWENEGGKIPELSRSSAAEPAPAPHAYAF